MLQERECQPGAFGGTETLGVALPSRLAVCDGGAKERESGRERENGRERGRGHWRLLSKCMRQEAAEKAVIRLWQLHTRIQRRVCVRSSGKTLTLCPEYALFSH
ncbi:hypothetical protein AOLI_G00230410 [Acnodon oligacanthus]